MLYIIATPIGNMADITYRAVDLLKNSSYILCEDTRHSLHLLKHYGIDKPLKSLHKFNESSKLEEIIEDLKGGLNIALISDAGTPGISDPGTKLIAACRKSGIAAAAIPGPCAAITALSTSGFESTLFQFLGFLPRQTAHLKTVLQQALEYAGTTICYESPKRLHKTLSALQAIAPTRKLGIARELTKKFEEFIQGSAEELLAKLPDEIKGEIVLLISSKDPKEIDEDAWDQLTPKEHVAWMQATYQLSAQEAVVAVAKLRGTSKRTIYNDVMKKDVEE